MRMACLKPHAYSACCIDGGTIICVTLGWPRELQKLFFGDSAIWRLQYSRNDAHRSVLRSAVFKYLVDIAHVRRVVHNRAVYFNPRVRFERKNLCAGHHLCIPSVTTE